MNAIAAWTLVGAGAYLAGSVPFGFLVARARGIDIRRAGSGNIGATNVTRCVGRPWGLLTFACDFLKGLLPALLLPAAAGLGAQAQEARLLAGALAIAGHNWPVFLGFRGGKGVATSAGALVAIAPPAVAAGVVVWAAVFGLSRYVSLASIMAALTVGALSWWPAAVRGARGLLTPLALSLLAVLVVVRHHANIRRLLNGTEPRRGKRVDRHA